VRLRPGPSPASGTYVPDELISSDVKPETKAASHGFVVFTAASAACGLAPSLPALIALRVLQAVGAAMLQANSVALVATSAPTGRRRAALGIQTAAQALGLALGPVAGASGMREGSDRMVMRSIRA
jgi:MFS family permease